MKQFIYLIFILLIVLSCSEIETKWEKKFDAAGPGDYSIKGIHVSHDIYVTGSFQGKGQRPQCITASYNEKGKLNWFTTYEKQTFISSSGLSIAGFHDGIYILLDGIDSDNNKNVLLIKYDEGGTKQWEQVVIQSKKNIESEMLFDYSGNVYIAGWTTDIENMTFIFVAKFQPSGELVWLSKYTNPSFRFDHLKFDIKKPGIFLVGGVLENSHDFFYLKYDKLGQFPGLIQHITPERESNLADIKIDDAGNVYLLGSSSGSDTGRDFLTAVYDRSNNILWTIRYDGSAHSDDIPSALAIDDSSNVYVTGRSTNTDSISEIVLLKYDMHGTRVWSELYTRKKNEPAQPYSLHPDFIHYDRNIAPRFYIIGTVGDDVILLNYNIHGNRSWFKTYSSGKGKKDTPITFSGYCLAVQSESEKKSEARIIKYSKSEIFGIARWD
jgi:outer membrane protein assembly factor BamB